MEWGIKKEIRKKKIKNSLKIKPLFSKIKIFLNNETQKRIKICFKKI
jgi:hypothetical protein